MLTRYYETSMDIYAASNYLSTVDLLIPDAIIIDDTVPHLHAADAATTDDTYLIQTDYPIDALLATLEPGVTVYSPTEDRAARIHLQTDDIEDIDLSPALRDRVQQLSGVRLHIPVGPYNSIHVLVPPNDAASLTSHF